jgi:mono/diheme cytochrome c family protein
VSLLAAVPVPQKLGIAFAVLLIVGWLVFIIAHVRRDTEPRGAEMELAPNRKQYYDDDELEGPKLERVLGMALILLVIIAIGLPLYWWHEPSRQAGAVVYFNNAAIERGRILFQPSNSTEPTHNVGHFGCANCHGSVGQGGSTSYSITTALGTTVQVTWKAPALNTVMLRYAYTNESDTAVDPLGFPLKYQAVRAILTYGRANTPMPAWGVAGGGPMNDQQISDLIAYLQSIQLTPAQAKAQAAPFGTNGSALFDAYCARCHTKGWSYGQPELSGGGAYGPNLTNGATTRQFPNRQDQLDFVTTGVEPYKGYGARGIQTPAGGGMPHFGQMMTDAQIAAVVDYERSL